jgi:hypothetical protein
MGQKSGAVAPFPNDHSARLKTARPRRVVRLSDFVAIWFSVSWRFISLAFSLGPMTRLRRPIWASTRALQLHLVADCHAILSDRRNQMKIRIGADHPYMIFVSENWGEALKIALHSLPNFTF